MFELSSNLNSGFNGSEIDDDSVADPNDPRAQDIGTIQVKIKYVRLGSKVAPKKIKAKDIGVVHEKAKKAGIHTTTLVQIFVFSALPA